MSWEAGQQSSPSSGDGTWPFGATVSDTVLGTVVMGMTAASDVFAP